MSSAPRIALVLGGGGPLGLIWMAEMLLGWAEGWKNGDHDSLAPLRQGRIVGTSAGAIVGAFLAAHGSLDVLVSGEGRNTGPGHAKLLGIAGFVLAFLRAKLLTREMQSYRRSMGRSALRAAVPGEAEWLGFITGLYPPGVSWPAHCDLVATVIDAASGEFHAWRSDAGVPLPVAVAASCAMPCTFPLVHAHGRAWMDGGIGSTTNATLAAGCQRVLILDPLGRSAGPRSRIGQECRALEDASSRVLLFQPDRGVLRAIGRNFFDMRRRPQVAAAARAQAQATAEPAWKLVHAL